MRKLLAGGSPPASLILLFLFFLFTPSLSQADLSELERRAGGLWTQPQWLKLTHYHKTFWGWSGLVDYPDFYLAEEKTPKAELIATLRAFHSEETKELQCRFVARYEWLNNHLGFDPDNRVACPDFQDWWEALEPESITLIFPGAYLNNPASMFGHTLIRVNGRSQNDRTRLLAYASNFGAVDTDPPGVIYAVKGIFGFYHGLFAVSPYYETVAKYSDIENRDIWELQLALTPDEVRILLLHLWELRSVYFDYYFFSENCSYFILALLEVARPHLGVLEKFNYWTIPSETVREIAQTPGLVASTTYRPAQSSLLRHRLSELSSEEVQLAKRLANSRQDLDKLSPRSQARVLESAYDILRYSGEVDKTYALELLKKRSELDIDSEFTALADPPFLPQDAHEPMRLTLGAGVEDESAFAEFGLRPAYHELLDPPWGYKEGYQISLLDITLRQYEGDGLELEQVVPLSIRSYSRRDDYFKPVSWDFKLSFERRRFDARRRVTTADLGIGLSHSFLKDILSYALVANEISYSSQFEGNYLFGVGPRLGFLWSSGPAMSVQLEGTGIFPYTGDSSTRVEMALRARYALARSHSINLSLGRIREYGGSYFRPSISYLLYF